MADPERTLLDHADIGPVVAPAAHSHNQTEIGAHADTHATGGTDPITPASIGAAEAGGSIYGGNADDAPDGTFWISGTVPITPTNGYPDGVTGAVAMLTTRTAQNLDYRVQTLVNDFGQEWRRLKRGSWLSWRTVTSSNIDAAPGFHATRHAIGGADEITPASIGAVDTEQVSGSYYNLSGPMTFFGPGEAESIAEAVKDVSASLGLLQYDIAGKADTSHADTHATGGTDEITPGSIGAQPTIQDTGWRRILSWTDGVQDTTGQVGIVNADAYTLIGNGHLDLRRRDNYVMFRSEFAVSGGGAIRSTTTTPRALFDNFAMPVNYRVNDGVQWGIMMPIGYRGEERLLIGSPGDQQSFGFCTPDGQVDIRGIAGGYPCTYPFPGSESYIGTPAPV